MEVILLERVEKLGLMGDVVTVKPGFARNFLLPQKKALRATKENIAGFETQRAQLEADNLERRSEAEAVASRMDGLTVVLVRQASESDHLYGSVTTQDIAREIVEAGFTIAKRQVQLDRPIKSVGIHEVRIRLHPEVSATVNANVARSVEEAKAQARGERPGSMEEEAEQAILAAEEIFDPGAAPQPVIEEPAGYDDAAAEDESGA